MSMGELFRGGTGNELLPQAIVHVPSAVLPHVAEQLTEIDDDISYMVARHALGVGSSEAIFRESFQGVESHKERECKEEKGEVMKLFINKITDGLGFGKGTISAKEIGNEVGADTLEKADKVINSPDILVEVSKDEYGNELTDDGCGDGRRWISVFQWVNSQRKEFKRSLNRYKVFGGGSTMVTAARIGAGMATGMSAEQNFAESIEMCNTKGLDFGGHTDEHAQGDNCGCGAIDKNPLIIAAAKEYRNEIKTTFDALGVDTEDVDEILDNYAAYANEIANDTSFKGSRVMDKIIKVGKIVKQLGGKHIEARIILNFVEGYTVNQAAVREATKGRVDVFAVDVPRLQKIADTLHPTDETTQKRAFKSMLVYTLATAAVLTAGDQPVWAVNLAPVVQPELARAA